MSKKSDQYELDVVDYINKLLISGILAYPNKKGVLYSDVILYNNLNYSYLEVKMNHTDNLCNNRFHYYNKKWISPSETPITLMIIDKMNNSELVRLFTSSLDKNIISNRKIPNTTYNISEMRLIMLNYYHLYILLEDNIDIGDIATKHYLYAKKEPAHYILTGDDFYLLGDKNPLMLKYDVPIFKGFGNLRVRISLRTKFYEVLAEVKIKHLEPSLYSLKPGTHKLHPFYI